jgi:SAM-dependent methyltransferase
MANAPPSTSYHLSPRARGIPQVGMNLFSKPPVRHSLSLEESKMAERANPDDPGFRSRLTFTFHRKNFPWIRIQRSPFRAAFFWRYRWVSRYSQGMDVIDVPCGMGWGTSLIRGTRSLVGIDLDTAAIEEARHRYGKTARFLVGDMAKLPLPSRSADLISCLEGIEHVPVEIGERFLRETHRVLRSTGLLLISSPYRSDGRHSGNPYHIHEYQPEEIRELVGRWFHIEQYQSIDVSDMTVLYLTCRKRNSDGP